MIWPLLGGLGQGCFALRCVVQWRAAERAGWSVAPRSFWLLSLCGALCMALYTVAGEQTLLAGGYLASAWIYARNLRLQADAGPRSLSRLLPEVVGVLAILALSTALEAADVRTRALSHPWLGALVIGQLLWNARFVLQWIDSERRGESRLSPLFWWLSLAGNALLLAYAFHLGDPLLIAAFAFGPVAQVRNLVLAGARTASIAP